MAKETKTYMVDFLIQIEVDLDDTLDPNIDPELFQIAAKKLKEKVNAEGMEDDYHNWREVEKDDPDKWDV